VAHEPVALREGTRPEAIAVVRDDRSTHELTPREALLIETVRALYRARRLTPDQYAKAEAELGRQALIELVTLAGYYGMVAFVLNAFEVDLPPGTTPPPFAAQR
jgi:4-carboxymuconolactone decarboxylase